MQGRYGMDQFGRFLFSLSFVFWILCFLCRFLPFPRVYYLFYTLNTVVYIYAFFRILSKNILNRTMENERYLHVREKLTPGIREFRMKYLDKDHIYKKCPVCGKKLRMERIRGKHISRCPKCGTKFNVRVFWDKR